MMGIKVSKDKNISRWVGQENLVYSRWNRIKSHVQTWRRWSLEENEVRFSFNKPNRKRWIRCEAGWCKSYIYPIRYFFIVTTSREGWPAKAKEAPVAFIMAAFIHVEYVDNISYHDLSSWCNRYTDAISIA